MDLNGNLYSKKYFQKSEVLTHIAFDDFWVILNQHVLDLSDLTKTMDEKPIKCESLKVMFI